MAVVPAIVCLGKRERNIWLDKADKSDRTLVSAFSFSDVNNLMLGISFHTV